MSRTVLFRTLAWPAAAAAVLMLSTLGLVLALSWSSLRWLEPVHLHLGWLGRLQGTATQLNDLLDDNRHLGPRAQIPELDARLATLDDALAQLASSDGFVGGDTVERLRDARKTLGEARGRPAGLLGVLEQLRTLGAAEVRGHEELLASVQRANRAEFLSAATAMLALPLLALAGLVSFRKRLVSPLKSLGLLLDMWAEKRYDEVPLEGVDPSLLPLFRHYNRIAARLDRFEEEHRTRQRHLEQQVRAATETLLEQQRELANADRLAAIGEVAAGLAHELRNPLASVRMACSNLRRTLADREQRERLDMIIGELQRMTRLLNGLLDQARQQQEASVDLDLAHCLDGLLELIRYQLPARVGLQHRVPEGLSCHLPEGRLRQALMNLVLNAVRSIGEGRGTVTVSARVDDRLRIEVHDDGEGFPATLLRDGIRCFTTLDGQGTGLGLSTVRRFAHDLGGTLALANHDGGRGACATLELPCHDDG